MGSLASIYQSMTDVDHEKVAQVEEEVAFAEDTLEKAAHYDEVGRQMARQHFVELSDDPEILKEAMGPMYGGGGGIENLPPALAAMAAKKKEEAKKKSGDEGEEEKAESKDEEKKEEALEEKKAAVLDAMQNNDEYLGYIMDKYLVAADE